MLSILNKWTLQKELQNVVTNNVLVDKQLKHNNNKTKVKHKNPCRAGNWTRNLMHSKRMRYHCTTEVSESIDFSQAI